MRPISGSAHRRCLINAHKMLEARLHRQDTAYITAKEEQGYGIVQLPALQWEGDFPGLDDTYSQPMTDGELHSIFAKYHHQWQRINGRCSPWIEAQDTYLCSASHRCGVGEEMALFLFMKLKVARTEYDLVRTGGWRRISQEEQRKSYRHIPDRLGVNAPYRIRAIMHAQDVNYSNYTWCVVADGSLEADCAPDDDKILRSELLTAMRLAYDLIKRDKSYKHSIYPVTIISLSMFYARIVQIHVDIRREKILIRKTPYMLIDSPKSDNIQLLMRWFMGSPVGETRRFAELPALEEEETDEATEPATHPSTLIPVIVVNKVGAEEQGAHLMTPQDGTA